MSIFEHSRWRIFQPAQHPYRHDISEFFYSNPAIPGISDLQATIDYLVAVMYPNYIGTFATPAALPGAANPNDYAVVTDDGDGKSAGYVWQVIEGVAGWNKRYDVDWSADGVLAELVNRTQYMYVHKYGMEDRDAGGTPIAGTFKGQTLYGGTEADSNLTLAANTTVTTGYIQVVDHFRPAADSAFLLGTTTERWAGAFVDTITSGTLTATGGSITDSSGQISFDNENLLTTGNITGAIGYYSTRVEVGPLAGDALLIAAGSITDESGSISFDNENLSTTGTLSSGVHTVLNGADTLIFTPQVATTHATIVSSLGVIQFGGNSLSGINALTTGTATHTTSVQGGNLLLSTNVLSSTNANGDITITPNGTGDIHLSALVNTLGITATGTLTVTGQANVDNLRLDGNVFSATNVDGGITLTPNGTGVVSVTSNLVPGSDNARSLGLAASRWTTAFLSTGISNGTNAIAMGTLLAFRSGIWRDLAQSQAAQTGDGLFYDAVNGVWLASAPDTEIDHGTISGLGDDDHSQYALLAGRGAGQTLNGGVNASGNLTLDSTAHATKGSILFSSNLVPTTGATYSGGWQGTDIGTSGAPVRAFHTRGEFFGMRFENSTSGGLPAANTNNVGRAVWATDNNKLYVDTGGTWIISGVGKYVNDTSWNGVVVQQDFTVSATISDARNAIWQLCDNADDFERIFCTIKAISATQVRVQVNLPLPAGSYRLIGVE